MPTPVAKTVRDAMASWLQGITGQYKPGAVVWFPFSIQVLTTGLTTVISLAKDLNVNTRITVGGSGGVMEVEMPVDLAIATKFGISTDLNPYAAVSRTRSDVQDELAQAVKNRLLNGDLGIPATVKNVTIPDEDHSYENTWEEGWAVVFMRVIVVYHHPVSAS